MSRELVNLLPPERIRAFRREYFLRLATVAVLFAAALVVIHGVLLFPSYLYLGQKRAEKERELAVLNANLSASGGDVVNARLAALTNSATYLAGLSGLPTGSAAIRAVLAVPRPGIAVTNVSYTAPSANAADGKMVIAGQASTREALRAYDLALSQLPFVSDVDLPISAYAEESDISFSMTLTGTLKP